MHGHNIVIAVLPEGQYGAIAAAIAAKDMLRTFPAIRICLMVGTGGGVPTKHDIRLGDVVVSSPEGQYGAVLQYDYGKTTQGQCFQPIGHLNNPPDLLLGAMTGFTLEHMQHGHSLAQQISEVLQNKPHLIHFKQPPADRDTLHYAHIIHETSCLNGCGEVPGLKSRRPREAHEDNPAIHYGRIASGNQLMKDAGFRDKLAKEQDVLCFEMEAGGLMNQLPCLVIRGISNYSDSHKNDEWQGYAAMTAATYAKALLKIVGPGRIQTQANLNKFMCRS